MEANKPIYKAARQVHGLFMKRIEILALLSLSLSSCSEYFDKQQSKNELKKKYSFALNYYVERLSVI